MTRRNAPYTLAELRALVSRPYVYRVVDTYFPPSPGHHITAGAVISTVGTIEMAREAVNSYAVVFDTPNRDRYLVIQEPA